MKELLFSLTLALCNRFPALTPFMVYGKRFHDVVTLFEDLRQENEAQEQRKANGGKKPPDGSYVMNGVLYKPAQNDDWW